MKKLNSIILYHSLKNFQASHNNITKLNQIYINYIGALIPTIPLEQINNSEVRDFILGPKDE